MSLPRLVARGTRAALATFGVAALATAQTYTAPSITVPKALDTGYVSNDGTERTTIAAFNVFEDGAPWMRLFFASVELSGSRANGNASVIKITSMQDGYHMLLDPQTVQEWSSSSAYFNGDLLLVEVIAYPGTGRNRLVLDHAVIGMYDAGLEDSICGSDDRILSNDPRAGRLLPIGCTGFLIDDACGCMLTAGHCSGTGAQTLQFNVPLSNGNGTLNHPPPSDQYAVDTTSKQFTNGGIGNDWGYMGTFDNSTTGLSAKVSQGAVYSFRTPPTWNNGLEVRITGYGVDGGTSNQVQQTHVGPWVSWSGSNQLQYVTDTQGGNSGSPVIQEQGGFAMGIHTHGGCTSTGGANSGTAGSHSGLQNALANPIGICKKTAPPTCAVTPSATIRNGSGINPICLTNVTQPALGTDWMFAVDPSVVAGGSVSVVRFQGPGPGTLIALGEALLDPTTPVFFQFAQNGPAPHVYTLEIPGNLELAGFTYSMQAAVGLPGDLQQLCNALDFTIGCAQ